MDKPEDQSRSRSLLHLLLATARSRVLSSNDLEAARQLVASIRVEEFGESWKISTATRGKEISRVCPKTQFFFYPTKSGESYTQEPYFQNKKNAQAIVEALFIDAGLIENEVNNKPINLRNLSVISGILVIQLSILIRDLVWNNLSLSHFLVTIYLVISLNKFYSKNHLRKKSIMSGVLILSLLTLGGAPDGGYLLNLGWVIFLDEIASLLTRYLSNSQLVTKLFKPLIFLAVLAILFFEFSDGSTVGVKLVFMSLLLFRLTFLTKMPKRLKEIFFGASLMLLIIFLINLMSIDSLLLFRLPVAFGVSIWLAISGSRSTPIRVFTGISLLGA